MIFQSIFKILLKKENDKTWFRTYIPIEIVDLQSDIRQDFYAFINNKTTTRNNGWLSFIQYEDEFEFLLKFSNFISEFNELENQIIAQIDKIFIKNDQECNISNT